MNLNGTFGNPTTWLLLLAVWLGLGALCSLALALVWRGAGRNEP